MAGLSTLSRVTTAAPVSITGSTGSPRRCRTAAVTAWRPIVRGSWATRASISPFRRASTRAGEVSKPTNFTFPARLCCRSASSMPNVDDSFGQKMPSVAFRVSSMLRAAVLASPAVAPA